LNKHNSVVAGVRFVDRISRKAREANLNDPHYVPIVEATIHVEDHPRRGGRRFQWWKEKEGGWRKDWKQKDNFPSCMDDYRAYSCGRTHLWLFVDHNQKLYAHLKKKRSKAVVKEINNPWLLNAILKKVSV
jgi:hypothetical protein